MSSQQRPRFKRVTKDEFAALSVGASQQKAFPPSGPEYYFKDGRHFGFENLTTGECVVFEWGA
ncbi:hypothetical protein [Metapseudomonas sp. CR1201]